MTDNQLPFALSFERQYAGPLDPSITFATISEMNDYLTNATRYSTQICTCFETPNKIYILSTDRTSWSVYNPFVTVPTITNPSIINVKLWLEDGRVIEESTPVKDRMFDILLNDSSITARITCYLSRGTVLGKTNSSGIWIPPTSQGYLVGTKVSQSILIGNDEIEADTGGYFSLTHSSSLLMNSVYISVGYNTGIQIVDSALNNYLSPKVAGSVHSTISYLYLVLFIPSFWRSTLNEENSVQDIDTLYNDAVYTKYSSYDNLNITYENNDINGGRTFLYSCSFECVLKAGNKFIEIYVPHNATLTITCENESVQFIINGTFNLVERYIYTLPIVLNFDLNFKCSYNYSIIF